MSLAIRITSNCHRTVSSMRGGFWNTSKFSTTAVASQNQSPAKTNHYDIIIVGGGMVGTTLACTLAKETVLSDKKVLLLEGAPEFKGASKDKYSNRVSALSPGTADLLSSIGAWDYIKSVRHKEVKQMQVWDACSDAFITFNHDNFEKSVAYIVENDLLLEAVYKQLAQHDNVTVKNSSRIESCSLHKDVGQTSVTLKGGETYNCDLLVGADGANSLVRKQMGVSNFSLSYKQMGVVATVEIDEAGDNSTAWQRFLPTGPVALLPLTNTLSSLVWSTTIPEAERLLKLEPAAFVDALNSAFYKALPKDQVVDSVLKSLESILTNVLGGTKQVPPCVTNVVEKSRAAFPLGFGHAPQYATEGAVLIGDAAHRVHPLAGQGVNLGFGDVKSLTQILSEAVYSGSTIGALPHLLTYEKQRLRHNFPIMLGIHGLQRLYSNDFTPLVALRSAGLRITNSLPPLKKLFMQQAMS